MIVWYSSVDVIVEARIYRSVGMIAMGSHDLFRHRGCHDVVGTYTPAPELVRTSGLRCYYYLPQCMGNAGIEKWRKSFSRVADIAQSLATLYRVTRTPRIMHARRGSAPPSNLKIYIILYILTSP